MGLDHIKRIKYERRIKEKGDSQKNLEKHEVNSSESKIKNLKPQKSLNFMILLLIISLNLEYPFGERCPPFFAKSP